MKNEKAKWLIETYTDKYRSLYQAIMIDLEQDGREQNFQRSRINPNLTILLRKEYYSKDMELLKTNYIINNDWYFEEIGDKENE